MKRYLALFLSLVMILCALPLAIAEDVENPYEDDGIVIYRDADGNVTRGDMILGLNRLSSLMWIFMINLKAGRYERK